MKISAKPRQSVEGPAIALLLPTRGNPTIETVQCLQNMDGYRTAILPAARMDVVKARNKLASDVKKISEKAPFIPKGGWLALWVDDDAFWRPGTVKQLVTKLLDDKDIDVIAGWYSGRSAFSNPKAFYANGNWPSIGQDCQVGDVVEVARVGFHFVLHKVDILHKLPADPFTIRTEGGEDVNFCDRATEAGLRIWVDTAAMVAHVGDDGQAYFPGCAAMHVENGQLIQGVPGQRSYGPQIDIPLSRVRGAYTTVNAEYVIVPQGGPRPSAPISIPS